MNSKPRIALIHATSVSVEPVRAALDEGWPDAEAVNLLDDSLSTDRSASADLSPQLAKRIDDLAQYARRIGSNGILFTCSAFGSAIEKSARSLDIPVLKPNEAMFEAALAQGNRVAMIYTFAPARDGMEDEFVEAASKTNPSATITSFLAAGAMDALRSGDAHTHNRVVAEKAAELSDFDVIMLAHFSTSRAASAARMATRIPILTSPDAAVAKIRRLVAQD